MKLLRIFAVAILLFVVLFWQLGTASFWDPDEGSVRLAGIDLRELTLDGLRRRIALVAQDTYLFNDTLEANVRVARPDASRSAIDRALEQAALSEFVSSLPKRAAVMSKMFWFAT